MHPDIVCTGHKTEMKKKEEEEDESAVVGRKS